MTTDEAAAKVGQYVMWRRKPGPRGIYEVRIVRVFRGGSVNMKAAVAVRGAGRRRQFWVEPVTLTAKL